MIIYFCKINLYKEIRDTSNILYSIYKNGCIVYIYLHVHIARI